MSGNRSKRPLSPHLTIYKPQITSVLSITHRLTGVGIYLGVLVFAWWVVFAGYGCDRCITPLISSKIGMVIMGLLSFGLYYHLLNGIRHLYWDIGRGYSLGSVNLSGILVVIASIVLTAGTWYVVLQ